MKFLIQKIDKEIRHDFSFTLLESIRYQNWLQNEKALEFRYFNSHSTDKNWYFKSFHQFYVPVGTVEFVTAWFKHFHNHEPLPINVPEELFGYAERGIFNGPHYDMLDILDERFVKSNDQIKGFKEVIDNKYDLPEGNYQFSELIEIESEWRAFVYQNKLVGLQNYSGMFSTFPNIESILWMIHEYRSAPVAYTLDVGVFNDKTFVIECHDFFSCGLYGFVDHRILPFMYSRWHYEYLKNTVYGNR